MTAIVQTVWSPDAWFRKLKRQAARAERVAAEEKTISELRERFRQYKGEPGEDLVREDGDPIPLDKFFR